MRGADGILAGLRPGATVVDFGTSLPASTRALATETTAAGGAYLDAPLGRTPAHAYDGLLNIMTAGDKAAYDMVEPTLKDLGENVFYLGASGAGHTTKRCRPHHQADQQLLWYDCSQRHGRSLCHGRRARR